MTLLSYSYWIREKGWNERTDLPAARVDLAVAYGLTGLFGIAVIALASVTLFGSGAVVEGREAAVRMSDMLRDRGGALGARLFLVGFWGAVASSLVGVWQSVPYLFADTIFEMRGIDRREGLEETAVYRGFLLFLAVPPMVLLFLANPVWLVIAYAALGSLFMPFLAGTLLFMLNRREWMGDLRNRAWANAGLAAALLLFLYLATVGILEKIRS